MAAGEKSGDDRTLARQLTAEITRLIKECGRPVRLMEVCGTHTVAIFRAGLRQVLPPEVELISGPGCPVCVTPDSYIDAALCYGAMPEVILTTFGDMLKVPGSTGSLSEAAARGADVRVVYSPLDGLPIAAENPDKLVIFLAVGFETTAPAIAASVMAAKERGLKNFFLLSAPKLVPPAMKLLLDDPATQVDGFLLPGHVAVVTGTEAFMFLPREYGRPGVVAGFEPLELLRAIYRLVKMTAAGTPRIENAYGRVVRPEGNPAARAVMDAVYEPTDADWRGLGRIPRSGLRLRDSWRSFDIMAVRPVHTTPVTKVTACRCGEVLKGQATPRDCRLFGDACVPEHAAGPCMVSVEGVCAAWYKYGRGAFQYGG